MLITCIVLALLLAPPAFYFVARYAALSISGIQAQGTVRHMGRTRDQTQAWRWVTVDVDGKAFEVPVPRGTELKPGMPLDVTYLQDSSFLRSLPWADTIHRIAPQFTPEVIELSGIGSPRWFAPLVLVGSIIGLLLVAIRLIRRANSDPPAAADWP